mmetsp:Transcript_14004/g.23322  ORF Transcript_14004/g.23322 Transcript_14004/m.23322 type:complete len:207 (+) Transcript_14004:180-800(+)
MHQLLLPYNFHPHLPLVRDQFEGHTLALAPPTPAAVSGCGAGWYRFARRRRLLQKQPHSQQYARARGHSHSHGGALAARPFRRSSPIYYLHLHLYLLLHLYLRQTGGVVDDSYPRHKIDSMTAKNCSLSPPPHHCHINLYCLLPVHLLRHLDLPWAAGMHKIGTDCFRTACIRCTRRLGPRSSDFPRSLARQLSIATAQKVPLLSH